MNMLKQPPPPRIKAVSGYQTSDGMIFDTSREAEAHQDRIDFYHWCSTNICCGGEWSAEMVADAIWREFKVAPREPDVSPTT